MPTTNGDGPPPTLDDVQSIVEKARDYSMKLLVQNTQLSIDANFYQSEAQVVTTFSHLPDKIQPTT